MLGWGGGGRFGVGVSGWAVGGGSWWFGVCVYQLCIHLIVRDEHDATRELLDAVCKRHHRLEIEIIRRLIKYKYMRLCIRHRRERHP